MVNYITEPVRLAAGDGTSRTAFDAERSLYFRHEQRISRPAINFFDQSNQTSDARLRYDWDSEYFLDSRSCRASACALVPTGRWTESVSDEGVLAIGRTAKTKSLRCSKPLVLENIIVRQVYTPVADARTSDRISMPPKDRELANRSPDEINRGGRRRGIWARLAPLWRQWLFAYLWIWAASWRRSAASGSLSAHIDGCLYHGDGGVHFAETLACGGRQYPDDTGTLDAYRCRCRRG